MSGAPTPAGKPAMYYEQDQVLNDRGETVHDHDAAKSLNIAIDLANPIITQAIDTAVNLHKLDGNMALMDDQALLLTDAHIKAAAVILAGNTVATAINQLTEQVRQLRLSGGCDGQA
jgi:hypothetical protein